MFSIHLRSEGEEVIEAVDEALDIAKSSEVNLKISHMKVKGEQNWAKLPEAVSLIENAYHRGIQVHFDMYPYEIGSTVTAVMEGLPNPYRLLWQSKVGLQTWLQHISRMQKYFDKK